MGLSTAQWSQVEALFAEMVDLSPDARNRKLDRASADPLVRAELDALLVAADSGGDFLVRPASVVSTQPATGSLVAGERVGPWRVLRLVGRGGMGEVYEAERADGQFEQRVAIKLVRQDSDVPLERFQAERQLLARLEHPGIARLVDGGVTAAGRPYAVMEYVEGATLTEWCRARAATLDTRLRIFLEVCDAVNAAHRAGVVHRDLKPANILVDAGGRVRLLDFGIARPLESARTPASNRRVDSSTRAATLNRFTPEYAAPEQLAGDASTAATDVHALGLILFELLTGQRARPRRGTPSLLDGRLASRAAADSPDAPVAPRLLRGDLDAIVSKCLRTAPGGRYPAVEALRADLDRSRRGEAVAARGRGRLYLFGRLLRRHRAAIAGVGGMLVLMLGAVFRGGLPRDPDTSAALYRTSNPEVFSQYELGHRFLARESQDGMRRAVDAFEKALQLEPNYAPALASLAVALTVRGRIGWREEGWGDDGRRALQAAEAAVALAPGLAEAHAARSKTRSWIAWDWAGAVDDAERAMRLKPGDGLAQQEYSALLGSLGRLPEAIVAARRATEADRLRGHSWHLLAFWYGFEGRYNLARSALDRVLELNPDSEIAAMTRAQLSLWEGFPQRALDEAAAARRPCLWCTAMARHSLGQAVESQRALDALVTTAPVVAAYRIAGVYAWRGEPDRAFEWLDRALAHRHPDLVFIKKDRTFLPLHGDARFKRLLETMHLPLD
jgi:tetratricopeptide (TPR) repeat protein/tRNA A-37 threonylcarbamoyl transferase component Bud32